MVERGRGGDEGINGDGLRFGVVNTQYSVQMMCCKTAPETCIILFTCVTLINSKEKRENIVISLWVGHLSSINLGFTTGNVEIAPNYSLDGWGLNEISIFLQWGR